MIDRKRQLLKHFPELGADFEITSDQTPNYNCFAWALEDDSRWWSPMAVGGYYWPPNCPTEWSVAAAIWILKNLGFSLSDRTDYENGFHKIAIYTRQGDLTHLARQLPNGEWTSKIAGDEDIRHKNAELLEGKVFGKISYVFKKSF